MIGKEVCARAAGGSANKRRAKITGRQLDKSSLHKAKFLIYRVDLCACGSKVDSIPFPPYLSRPFSLPLTPIGSAPTLLRNVEIIFRLAGNPTKTQKEAAKRDDDRTKGRSRGTSR